MKRLTWKEAKARRAELLNPDAPLPGFEHCADERARVRGAEQAEEMTAILGSAKGSIEAKAGEIEQHSPLFRGHGPQGEMF